MSDHRRVVVPFDRPAAYWANRARRHDTPARRQDAARLMRKALEKSGDPRMAMELYRIYADMECHTAAERCLATATVRGGLTGEICFGIGCCALNRGDETLAERALEQSLHLEPNGLYAEQIQDLLESYPWTKEDLPPRGARGETLFTQAQRALAAGSSGEALALAKKAWKKSHSYDIALLLGALLPPAKAIFPLTFACRRMPAQQSGHLMLALAKHHAGQSEHARIHMMIALMLCGAYHQVEKFCAAAWEMNMAQEALSLVEMHLNASPASADYLRLKYLCLKRLGKDHLANRALSSLMEMDPDDASALWYRRHPEEMQLYPGRMMMLYALAARVYALPERLRPGPLNRMLHRLTMMLSDILQAPVIYQLLPPLWRRLSPAEKAACDAQGNIHYPLTFCLYILLRTGYFHKARELLAHAPGKMRALRTLKRYMRWMDKE